MMTQEQISQVLQSSGVSSDASEARVREVLTEARLTPGEIETALRMRQSAPAAVNTKTTAVHKLFRSEQSLQPDEIQQLLGIEVSIDTKLEEIERRRSSLSTLQYILVWFFSVVVAVTGILFYMYVNHVGLFHETVGLVQIR